MHNNRTEPCIALPWNISRYVPCNGFHPLYQSLIEDSEGINFVSLDDVQLTEKLLRDEAFAQGISNAIQTFRVDHGHHFEGTGLRQDFYNYLTEEEAWFVNELPGDIELHHTSPLTLGKRAFVLHCESFLPIFMPFAYQGQGFNKDISAVRDFYGDLFSSINCLAIYSHMPETLRQISWFFQRPEIDDKLSETRIGLAESSLKQLTASPKPTDQEIPIFLFTASAQQNPKSFRIRGGVSCIQFALNFLASGRSGRFVFRCARPEDDELIGWGIDLNCLRRHEGVNILWLEGYLTQNEFFRLMICADFYLLPSVNLHSVSIMQAMAAGAIPVVTDTYGTDRYVRDGITGIVLSGVKEKVWIRDEQNRVIYDLHSRFDEHSSTSLSMQMMARLTALADDKKTIKTIQEQARQHAQNNFSGHAFAQDFKQKLSRHFQSVPLGSYQPSSAMLGGLAKSKIDLPVFESPPAPYLILNTGNSRSWLIKGCYYTLRNRITCKHGLDYWSPLLLMKYGSLTRDGMVISRSLGEIHDLLLPPFSTTTALLQIRRIERLAYNFLRPHPRLFNLAKKLYFLLRASARKAIVLLRFGKTPP